MADTLGEGNDRRIERPTRASARRFVTDGPPLLPVALLFGGLLAWWLAPGSPALLAVLLAAALLLTMALEFRRWGGHLLAERSLGPSHPIPLRQRLDQARIRRIQRDRWR